MTYDEAKELKVSTSVMWDGDPEDAGVVTDINEFEVRIEWDNGIYGWIHKKDLHNVYLLPEDWDTKGGDDANN